MAEEAGAASPGAKGSVEVVEPSQVQQAHARRVAESKATVPHVYLEAEAELHNEPAAGTERLVGACARALGEFPRLNATYRDGRFELHSRINVGVAVSAQGSVLYPTIHDAADKDVSAIATELEALADRARSGAITQPELSGATFSIADLSQLGIARATLAVNRGQAAILAVGATGPGTRSLCLSADNRIVQTPDGAAFLAFVGKLLAGPPDTLA